MNASKLFEKQTATVHIRIALMRRCPRQPRGALRNAYGRAPGGWGWGPLPSSRVSCEAPASLPARSGYRSLRFYRWVTVPTPCRGKRSRMGDVP
ncbi:hypothetical protein SKAU_G00012960 [Synaphobranchus kaupii]|uniref:Uncharacterized protein n=1 Tax=Synaphobranchus kaupii TaxID=118154 RepID=A0A9Q1JCD0_SYNKA|nr:hypothetical protein SKAU_G00012960 [Synaphobranchus kaupii]